MSDTTIMQSLLSRPHIEHVDDERGLGNGVIVTLKEGHEFVADPGCGVRGFDTLREALKGTTHNDVRKS